MRKHVYNRGWPYGCCIYCGRMTGLDDWQLKDMPTEMAVCPKGKKVGFFEWIVGKLKYSFDCSLSGNKQKTTKMLF